jgi:hypothetical protein
MRYVHIVPARRELPSGERPGGQPWRRPEDVPAAAIPSAGDKRRAGSIVSVLIHVVLVLLLLGSVNSHDDPNVVMLATGAGGPGPAGGGGGGNRGTGGVRYVTVAPPQQAPAPKPVPKEEPRIELPKPVPVPPPTPVLSRIDLPVPKLAAPVQAQIAVHSPTIGAGGGSGSDGSNGNGPGRGGGVGSGIGTGRGSGVGAGTGGGDQQFYPPVVLDMFLPPLPLPSNVRGTRVIVEYVVDANGRVVDWKYNHTRNKDYNKALDAVFKGTRFRPGTTLDGTPVEMKVTISYDLGG